MWKRGLYQLPSIWDAIEVISMLPDHKKQFVLIKGVDKALPTPLMFSTTCPNCNEKILNVIREWNLTGNYKLLKECKKICDCWKEVNNNFEKTNLMERYSKICDTIKNELTVEV